MLEVTADPTALGLDPGRLRRIDDHLRRYVDDGRLAGWQVVVGRRGTVAHSSCYGQRDKESGAPVEPDTLWRVYSMTKAITTVAAMSLYEQGAFSLDTEISRFLPEFAEPRVLVGGTAQAPRTRPAMEPIRMWHLMSHTAGLTYGFTRTGVLDEMYRDRGSDIAQPAGLDLAALCRLWAGLPLLFDPGTAWNYSVATDVLGRVIEVCTGQSLAEVFTERVLGPLGMSETDWWTPPAQAGRLAALYAPHPQTGIATRYDTLGSAALTEPDWHSGGGGLISTAADYHRFTQMLLCGGSVDGVRILGPRTLAHMTRNHLPGGATLAQVGRGQFSEAAYDGMAFGLGFAIRVDPVLGRTLASPGEYAWGGYASTAFWVDPVEQITAVFLTQLLPSSTYPIRNELRQLVYQAVID